jgi:RIO-like serine/threonine protein kinase
MTQCTLDYDHPRFGGETFDEAKDGHRLRRQLDAVRSLMADGNWRTLDRIATVTEFPEASVSARLRQLRHEGLVVERRRVTTTAGTWEYRVVES